ncbi:flavodoxin [Vibrio maerlii]|uniref:flavodoxin n=1 Tax=Vibrio maerlii TaxID=2231648 RepID=UPI000E3C4DF9|nr:flavodoxin [Vibrio maerlii]
MSISNQLVEAKNQWLSSHVDVPYPTKESLLGRSLYQEYSKQCSIEPVEVSNEDIVGFDLHKVDFHRLTVMFADLQASRWKGEERALVLEFLSQIILDDVVELYIVGDGSGLVSAFTLTKIEHSLLIGDLIITQSDLLQQDVVAMVNKVYAEPVTHIWVEA